MTEIKNKKERARENKDALENDREPNGDKGDSDKHSSARENAKAPEPRDNLRRRAEWFQKRH